MSEVLISIIMPVYNAAEFLAPTLGSVLQQSFQQLELIAVDDGSQDNSLEILQGYEKIDSRLVILQQENSGPSAARNNALQHARGKYVFFLDADDMLAYDALESLYRCAETNEADLVIAKYDIYNGVSYAGVSNLDDMIKKKDISKYAHGILWTFSLWNKLFRRDLIEKMNLRFAPISYSEDGVFTMRYVYGSSKISGLNKVVLHYRRMPYAEQESITATVKLWKVQDYLTAHKLIYQAIKESFMKDFQGYEDFTELCMNEKLASDYVNEFLKKEVTILINQFYKKFWKLEDETIRVIAESIRNLLHKVDLEKYYQIISMCRELDLENLCSSQEEGRKKVHMAVAVLAESFDEAFLQTVRSLCAQTMIPMLIYVPKAAEDVICEAGIWQGNICMLEGQTREECVKELIDSTEAEYVMFTSPAFSYEQSSFIRMYQSIREMNLDVLDNLVYLKLEGKLVECTWHDAILQHIENRRVYSEDKIGDHIWENKLIRLAYLKKLQPDHKQPEFKLISEIMRNAYFAISRKNNVIFEAGSTDADYIEYVRTKYPEQAALLQDPPGARSLSDPQIVTDLTDVYAKLRPAKVGKKKRNKRLVIDLMAKLPVQNKVLFYSIRKDDRLEGNLKAIYDKVKGRKLICAKLLPHKALWKMYMYYEFATAKVIVVDDYARYLRLFPLKPEQRVVQLWHACGVFKKFGIHGTQLSRNMEVSTHVQYNLVSVSAEKIRRHYASAFDIDISKISALGVPRTDIYFDEKLIAEKQEEIYKAYPEFKGKRIYLYAPTFRDVNAKREVFVPQIDFEDLSKQLPDNTVFIVAPHPIMKAQIVKELYDNVREIRDISTGDLMFISDLLITDYSSVIFEYALLKKPIVFYCYDKQIYDRGFYLDYDKDLPGEILTTYKEFIAYLQDPDRQVLTERYAEFVEKYMSACDGHSSERIANIINEYMEK